MENDSVLKVSNVSKTFCVDKREVKAVHQVGFEILKGKCLGLIGESGSGKSTLAQIIAGFENADEGKVYFSGEEVSIKKRDFAARYGMQLIFQNPSSSLNPKMKIKIILSEAAKYLSDMSKNERFQRAKEALQLVHLPESYLERYPYELSGGECQRVAIARALMLQPKLLICDEITSALDVSVQAQIMQIINELKKTGDIAILFITHDLSLVGSICDDLAVLHKGKIVEYGSTDNILHNGKEDYTKLLVQSVLTVR